MLRPAPDTTTSTRLTPIELLLKYDKPVPRYTSYPTAGAFSSAVGNAQLKAQLAEPCSEPLSLYVHVPFCRHACWYCGCNRVTTQLGSKVVAPYLAALAQELQLVTAAMPQRRALAQLHLGGGTPNYLNDAEMATLWGLIEQHFDLAPQLEASIELNPEFVSRDQAMELHRLALTASALASRMQIQKFRRRSIGWCQLTNYVGSWPGCGRLALTA